MADKRSRAEKLAAMAAASESPNEAAIAASKLAREAHSEPRTLERGFGTFGTAPQREARPFTGVDLAGGPDIVVVFVDDYPEEAEVDDYGPFAGAVP